MLQEEARISTNSVKSVDSLTDNLLKGRWSYVLNVCNGLDLPQAFLVEVYEELLFELIEKGEFKLGQDILSDSQVCQVMKHGEPALQIRYRRLLNLLQSGQPMSSTDLRLGSTKAERRLQIVAALHAHITPEEPSKLIHLLRQGLLSEKLDRTADRRV